MSAPTVMDVDDVTLAFPARVVGTLLPAWGEIPDEFKQAGNQWCQLAERWFFRGLGGSAFYPKPGVDPKKAVRHVSACLGSFEPKHEHKEAGCAYLLATFFERVEIDGAVVASQEVGS